MKLSAVPRIELQVQFEVTEVEARALDAMAGYGADAFVQAFHEHLGEAYMRDYEAGLRSFLKTVREQMPSILGRVDAARKVFEGDK